MCRHTSAPVTLQDAVLEQVTEFATNNQTFSVHDVTRNIRTKVAQGGLEIPEVEVTGATFKFDIRHDRVKSIFLDLLNTGIFDPNFTLNRQFNGTYFEYTPALNSNVAPASVPSVSSPYVQVASVSSQPNVPKTSTGKTDSLVIKDRVKTYLANCVTRQFRPTLKQIQSAIKRGNVSTGWSVSELENLIVNELGYKVLLNPNRSSRSQVVTV